MSVRARPSAPLTFQAFRPTRPAALFLVPALLATLLGGCAGSPSGPDTTASGDVAEHTAEEIVELVRNDLAGSPTTEDERTAANHLRSGDDHRWASEYADPKTWTVELIVPGKNDSRAVYRWWVRDYSSKISFLGVFRGSVIEPVR